MLSTYKVVTICGSMRFYPAMIEAAKLYTHNGWIVLMPHDTKADTPLSYQLNTKLDEMHLVKIDLSDAILVISNGRGYRGESTKAEIDYARRHGKRILYLTCDEIYDELHVLNTTMYEQTGQQRTDEPDGIGWGAE